MKRLGLCFLIASALLAQSDKKKFTFEVVSIKRHNPGTDPTGISSPPGGKFSARNIHLRELIVAAYVDSSAALLPGIDITGLTGWAASEGFDVQAQPEAGFTPTKQQTMEMLQAMLEDRFKLKIRRESKNASIYALVVDKGGTKMKRSEGPAGVRPASCATPTPTRLMRVCTSGPIAQLLLFLNAAAGRKVVDKTGLTGVYDIDMTWLPDTLAGGAAGADQDTTWPTLFTALPEQLGLRLASETGPVDTFVVESVQKPSEN